MGMIEFVDASQVEAVFSLAPECDQTPGTITITDPATLIAIWGGDSWNLPHSAVPDNGFVAIDSDLMLGRSSGLVVAFLQKEHCVPRFWARTLTTRFLKSLA